jgi:hypothetical protein
MVGERRINTRMMVRLERTMIYLRREEVSMPAMERNSGTNQVDYD